MLIPVEAVLGHIEDACSALCASKAASKFSELLRAGFREVYPLRWVGPEVKQPLVGLATSRTTDIEFPAINKRCLGKPRFARTIPRASRLQLHYWPRP